LRVTSPVAHKVGNRLPGIMDLYGVGDHGGGPTRAILDEGFHWAEPEDYWSQSR
jgi:alpha-mannosidase